jgi:flagellar protein FlaG
MQGISSAVGSASVPDLSKQRQTAPDKLQQATQVARAVGVNQTSDKLLTEAPNAEIARVDEENVNKLLGSINQQLATAQMGIRFKSDDQSGRFVFSIYDVSTNEVIRQVPSEEVLSTSQKLKEFLDRSSTEPNSANSLGLILDKEA